MYSLLTQEIKKYNLENNNLINNNLKKNKELTNFQKISINVCHVNDVEKKIINNINNNQTNFLNKEYSINMNIFNPMKNSPPNNWNCRLLSRINSLNSLNDLNSN